MKFNVAILFDSNRKYDRDVMSGIAQYTAEYSNWSTFLVPPQYMFSVQPAELMQMVYDWKPDGIITRSYDNWEMLKKLNVPMIVSSFDKMIPDINNLAGDDIAIAKMAADYFIKKGFKNFAYFGHAAFYWSECRKKAFQKEVSEKGFSFQEIPDNINQLIWHKRPHAIAGWLKEQVYPLAVYAACDEFALLISEAIRISGLKSPYDVALLGTDNDENICNLTSPKISSIDQNAELAGYLAAKHLQALISKNKEGYQTIKTKPKCVIERKSTDIIAVNDLNLQKAISFIKEQAIENNISVNDVVEASGVSRRLLEIRFQKELSLSILSYIKEVRIKHINKLLVETNLSVKEIAAIMDFTNLESISRYFKAEVGLSPSDFRKKNKI